MAFCPLLFPDGRIRREFASVEYPISVRGSYKNNSFESSEVRSFVSPAILVGVLAQNGVTRCTTVRTLESLWPTSLYYGVLNCTIML
jgi:hypothetical protein